MIMDAQITAAIIGAVIGAAMSAVCTFFLSMRQFRSEKWWELKVSSYQEIIEALHHAKKSASYMLASETGEAFISKDLLEKLKIKAAQANEEILKTIDIGTFVISPETVERLQKYSEKTGNAWEEINNSISFYEYLEIDLEETTTCLTDLMILARKDLGHVLH